MFAASLIALAALPSAFAAVSVTAPVGTTSWQAGVQQVVQWMDDGKPPSLQDMGVSMVSIYVGSQTQQTQLQLISNNVDVSTVNSLAFTPDPTIGPNSSAYFIRFESMNFQDPTTPGANAEAFSAKFALTSMSGTFNATVQAEIDAGNSSGAGSATSGSAGTSSTPATTPSSSSKPAASSSSAKSSGSPSPTGAANKVNGAAGVFASAGLVGTIAAAIGAMLL